MKKLISIFAATAASVIFAAAQFINQPALTDVPYATTNSFILDASYASSMGLQVTFAGLGDHTTTANLGVTGNPSNNASVGITIAGSNVVYAFTTNTVITTLTNLSGSGTNLTLPIANRASTNGDYVMIALNGITNTFTFTNTPVAGTDVLTNSTAAGTATNLMLVLGAYYNTVSISAATNVIVASGVGGAFNHADSGISPGDSQAIYYTITNIVATNSHQVAVGATYLASATNLAVKLSTDYPNNLAITYAAANVLTLVTLGNPGFSLTNSTSPAWATNLITTNAIAGGLVFVASNSVDQLTWFPDVAKNFTVNYSSTSPVGLITNWTSIGGIPFWKFTVQNAAANYAVPSNLRATPSVKRGL